MYIYTKNLKKNNNNDIYTFDNFINIDKINNYRVKTSLSNIKIIYHNILNIYIPLTTYFLLELDSNNSLINTLDNNYILTNNFLNKNDILKLLLSNESDIIVNNNQYQINLRLLSLMKKLGINGQLIIYIIKSVVENSNTQLSIINNKINLIS